MARCATIDHHPTQPRGPIVNPNGPLRDDRATIGLLAIEQIGPISSWA
ncbi:unnamed protein product [Acidithrix sp. C25]|nr:unnamed protein product [Acidithrix sp. C25]